MHKLYRFTFEAVGAISFKAVGAIRFEAVGAIQFEAVEAIRFKAVGAILNALLITYLAFRLFRIRTYFTLVFSFQFC